MKRIIQCSLFVISFCTSAVFGQTDQQYDTWSNFHIKNSNVFWQNIYPCPEMSRDSIGSLILSVTKAEPRFTITNKDGDELTFLLSEKLAAKNGFRCSGKIMVELKDEKYRLTFMGIELVGPDPQSTMDTDELHFKTAKLTYLTELNGIFLNAFDFKRFHPSNFLEKNW